MHRPRASTARSAASTRSKSGASGRVSGRIAPVMQHRAVPGRAVLADPSYGGAGAGARARGRCSSASATGVEVGQVGPGVAAVDRAQERAAVVALGPDQARQVAGAAIRLSAATAACPTARQPQPQVGLDHGATTAACRPCRRRRAAPARRRRRGRRARQRLEPPAGRPCAALRRTASRRRIGAVTAGQWTSREVVAASRRPRCRSRTRSWSSASTASGRAPACAGRRRSAARPACTRGRGRGSGAGTPAAGPAVELAGDLAGAVAARPRPSP